MRLSLSATFLLAGLASAQTSTTWVNDPGGVSIATDAVDNVYTVRWDYNPGGDIYLAKRDVAGSLQWEVRYDNVDPTKHEVSTWVDTDNAGNILVSGTVRSGYSNPVNANSLLMKFAPDGQLLWRRVYEGAFDGSSTRKLLVDGADNVYVLGLGSGPGGMVTTVKKFSPTGVSIWSWFDAAGIGAPANFKWTPDGALVISGRGIVGSVNGYAKIDRDGLTIWSLPGILSLTVGDAAGDAAGNSYLIHGDYAAGAGCVLRKVDPNGGAVWNRTHAMAGFRVEVGTDQAPVVSGFPNSGTVGAAFMKFDASGNFLWANLDADGPSVGLLAHAQMKLDASDSAYLAGGTMSAMGVTKIRSDGASAWTVVTPFGYAHGLSLGHAGRVFVTGGRTARIDQGDPTRFTSLCDPGLAGVIACPCSNPPIAPGRGCDNSASTGGAILSAAGGASLSLDSLVFHTAGEKPTALSLLAQWTGSNPSGQAFGMGVRCTSGTFKRLFVKSAVGGSITAPNFGAGDPTVSARSAEKGDTILAGQSRWYLVYYRDNRVLGGCPATSNFNATQTGQVAWGP